MNSLYVRLRRLLWVTLAFFILTTASVCGAIWCIRSVPPRDGDLLVFGVAGLVFSLVDFACIGYALWLWFQSRRAS